MHDFKKGDAVYLIFLDGRISSPKAYIIHDLWGDETFARNASYIIEGTGGEEQHYHTDLMVRVADVSPTKVPPITDHPVPDGGVWYIARGNNRGWGRAPESMDAAIRNMRAAGGKADSYAVHKVSKWTTVDEMGSLSYPTGIAPVEVKRVEAKKTKTA